MSVKFSKPKSSYKRMMIAIIENKYSSDSGKTIEEFIADYMKMIDDSVSSEERTYAFMFDVDGYNTIRAKSRKDAIKKAKKEYKNVIEDSVVVDYNGRTYYTFVD